MVINSHLSQLLGLRDARFRRIRPKILQICDEKITNEVISNVRRCLISVRCIKSGTIDTKSWSV